MKDYYLYHVIAISTLNTDYVYVIQVSNLAARLMIHLRPDLNSSYRMTDQVLPNLFNGDSRVFTH